MIRYIIDGHNTIHSVPRYLEVLDRDYVAGLEAIISDCALYCENKDVQMILVFDGNPPFEVQKYASNLKVIFSGGSRDADAVIAESAGGGRSTIVVTNDGGLKRLTASKGARPMSPTDFSRLISTLPKGQRGRRSFREKEQGLTPREVERWKKEMTEALKKKR